MTQILNNAISWSRSFFGLPKEEIPVRATEMLTFGEVAIASSGLDACDQRLALRMVAGLAEIYPGVTQDTMDMAIDYVIAWVRNEAKHRVERNQLALFDATSLEAAQPINRRVGLKLMRDLAFAMVDAERSLREGPEMAYMDRVDNAMDAVCRSRSALAICAEWGFVQTDFGVLLTPSGTTFGSQDLLRRIINEPWEMPTV